MTMAIICLIYSVRSPHPRMSKKKISVVGCVPLPLKMGLANKFLLSGSLQTSRRPIELALTLATAATRSPIQQFLRPSP